MGHSYFDDEAFSDTSIVIARCYESHPVLKVGKGKLIGGNASLPILKTADVYVSLQSGSTCGFASDPWEDQAVVEVRYTIQDMHAPANVPRFKRMVTWIGNQLQQGKTVHVGCIGGHGRTGVVFSAVVAEVLKKKDAIQYVRKHYCKKAVESKSQVEFLMKHYGVTETTPTKGHYSEPHTVTAGGTKADGAYWDDRTARKTPQSRPAGITGADKAYTPMSSGRSLWRGKRKTH